MFVLSDLPYFDIVFLRISQLEGPHYCNMTLLPEAFFEIPILPCKKNAKLLPIIKNQDE